MTKNLDNEGLKSIADQYDLFFIDLWGVIHNGIELYHNSIFVLEKLLEKNKEFVLLTNAPRPNLNVQEFLKRMKLGQKFYSKVYTSGEAALNYLNYNLKNKTFFHLGPPRDASLFEKQKANKTEINKCDFILCTGLSDEYEDDLNYYKKFLEKQISKKLVCTNPDLTVHRGNIEELCAGSVAKVFEELGGKVIYYGKPHKEIYSKCFDKNEKVLAIGDNLRTDIKGANNLNIDSIFITEGVHRQEIGDASELDALLKKYKVKTNFFQKELTW